MRFRFFLAACRLYWLTSWSSKWQLYKGQRSRCGMWVILLAKTKDTKNELALTAVRLIFVRVDPKWISFDTPSQLGFSKQPLPNTLLTPITFGSDIRLSGRHLRLVLASLNT